MNEINSFTFYRDYFNLIDTLPVKDKMTIAIAILDYVFKDIEPNLTGHNLAIFNTLKHQIDKSKNKSKNAKKIQTNEEKNNNQNEIKLKSNENQNNINKDNKTSVLSFKFYINDFNSINNNTKLICKLEDWFNYKLERKNKYTETGIKTLLNKVDKNVSIHGADKVIELIDNSISNNYQGIIWDSLTPNNSFKNQERSNQSISEQIDAMV